MRPSPRMNLALLAMALGAGHLGSLPAVRMREEPAEPKPVTAADQQRLERAAEKRRRKAARLAERGRL